MCGGTLKWSWCAVGLDDDLDDDLKNHSLGQNDFC